MKFQATFILGSFSETAIETPVSTTAGGQSVVSGTTDTSGGRVTRFINICHQI